MLGELFALIIEILGFRIGEKEKIKKGRVFKILGTLVIILDIGLVINKIFN